MKTFVEIAKQAISENPRLLTTFVGRKSVRRSIKIRFTRESTEQKRGNLSMIVGSYNYGSGVFEIAQPITKNAFEHIKEIRSQIEANYDRYFEGCFKGSKEFADSVKLTIVKI